MNPWLLTLGAIGIALVAGLVLRLRVGYSAVPRGTRMLSRGDHAFLTACGEITFPHGGVIPPSGTEADIPGYLDSYLAALPLKIRVLMKLLFFLLEHGTLLFPVGLPSGLRRFSSLSPEQQIRYLEGWQHSRLGVRRLVFTSLRSLVGMAYLADPAVLRALNLAPKRIARPVGDADLLWPPVGQPRSALLFAEADRTPRSDGEPLDPSGPVHADFEGVPHG